METRQTWSQQITERVRLAIKDSGMTEEYVGQQAGIPNATLSRRLNGHYPLTIADLENIAAVIGIDPNGFMPAASKAA